MIVRELTFFVMIAIVSLKVITFMKIVAIYVLIVFMYVSLSFLTSKLQKWLCLETMEHFYTI